ncbi:beta-1,4-N-acetylgalactosaminyltransferase bre-4 [Anopheles bellator]|uniref:beta-1,4-N-acetylgalactosaminyltransferase bre-4 n=1 Tax=Anopheles bellator TaxID=139047 RepID=UPI002647EE7B|nr:beta-1,4-N-acetylgalactosaminyltransferase bre-4 [Anopheles bellator]
MAFCNRTLAIKAALGAGFLLILLNLLNSKLDSSTAPSSGTRFGSTHWPKRTHGSGEKHTADRQDKVAENVNSTSQHNYHSNQNRSLGTDETVLQTHNNTFGVTNSTPESLESHANLTRKIAMSSINGPVLAALNSSSNKIHNNSAYSISSSSRIANHSDKSSINSNKLLKPKFQHFMVEKSNVTLENVAASSTVLPIRENTLHSDAQTDDGMLTLVDKFTINSCPPIPPNLDGPIEVDVTYESINVVESRYSGRLQPGGQYAPTDCAARNRVAIIVPYRDREQHLPIFLKNIHPFLMKQQLEYGIYIVEQTTGSSFNRAALMNIGFAESMKQKNWECMVFHDIDLLPMDDRNLYTCPDQPRHMSVAVDTFGFKLPYSTIFGGVSAMTEKQFRMVNGFSNSFWGWGGEDDDMSNRLKHVGFHIARYPVNIARYTMLSHKKEKANPKRYEKLVNGAKHFDSDGLNSMNYQLVNLIKKPLYTWVHVEISPDSS